MNDLEDYGEILEMYRKVDEQKQREFAYFLRFCAQRLEEGSSVEEIWNEWCEIFGLEVNT